MKLTKVRIGDYVELVDNRNYDEKYTLDDVSGISTSKTFIQTKAKLDDVNLRNYKIVNTHEFAYVADTSRRGEKIAIAYADSKPCIISSVYTVFKIRKNAPLIPRYLMIFFNRPEFDRYARFNSWGSVREIFNWNDFCDIELEVPSIDIQKKYVAIYEGMLANLHAFEKRLDDLKLVCDGYIENLFKTKKRIPLLNYIKRRTEKNNDFKIKKLIGVGKNGFIQPKQSKDESNGHICYLVRTNDFVYAPPQIHQGSIDLHRDLETLKCSDSYVVFYVNSEKLNSEFLFAILKTPLFQKFASYYRDGVREQFDFQQLCSFEIPDTPIDIQTNIVHIFKQYLKFNHFVSNLKKIISTICPILIRGSILEAQGDN